MDTQMHVSRNTEEDGVEPIEASAPGAAGATPPGAVGAPPPAAGDGQGGAATQKNKTRRVALYLRVSTTGQTVENQERELREVAARAGWEITEIYKDEGISGAKGREKRPAFDAMLKDAVRRKFDLVASWSVDRLGRSLQDLVGFLSEIHGSGVDLYLHQQALDTSTPAGRAMFQVMGVFAEFERAMIVERVKSGMARARSKGKHMGRPAVPAEKIEAIKAELLKGTGINKTARLVGVGVLTVQNIKKEMEAA